MLFGEGASCHILYSIVSYLYVSCSGSITLVGEERANLFAIVSVRRGFFFLLVLGMGCIILCGTPWAFNIIILNTMI